MIESVCSKISKILEAAKFDRASCEKLPALKNGSFAKVSEHRLCQQTGNMIWRGKHGRSAGRGTRGDPAVLKWFSARACRGRVAREQQRHLVSRRTGACTHIPGRAPRGAEGSRPRFNEKSLFPGHLALFAGQLSNYRPTGRRGTPTPPNIRKICQC